MYKKNNPTENVIKEVCKIPIEDYTITEKVFIHNDKSYSLSFISDNHMFCEKTFLNNKNVLVHCSIIDEMEDIIIDITSIIRRFSHYYTSKSLTLRPFFKYIEYYFNNNKKQTLENLDIYKYRMLIYLNDRDFSEYKYSVKDIDHKTFYDIFNEKVQKVNEMEIS